MRTVKTVGRIFLEDVKKFRRFFMSPECKVIYVFGGGFVLAFGLAVVLESMFGVHPGTAGIFASVIVVVGGFGCYWLYTIINRAKQQVNRENKQVIQTLRGRRDHVDWID